MPRLPDLVLQTIFANLDFADLAKIACADKCFHAVAQTTRGNKLSFPLRDINSLWVSEEDATSCRQWLQQNLSRLDRVTTLQFSSDVVGSLANELLGPRMLLPSLRVLCCWGPVDFQYSILLTQLESISIAAYFPASHFGSFDKFKISHLFGHLVNLELLQITLTSVAKVRANRFTVEIDAKCSQLVSLLDFSCRVEAGSENLLIVCGPLTVFPKLQSCIIDNYQESAHADLVHYANFDMPAAKKLFESIPQQ